MSSVLLFLSLFVVCFLFTPLAFAEPNVIDFDRYVRAEITYPDGVVTGEKFTISFFIKNIGNSERQNIKIILDGQDSFISISKPEVIVPRLSSSGHFGKTLDFLVSINATIGIQYINLNYTSGEDSQNFYNTALPIKITNEPQVVITTTTPDSIFTDAEFPFDVQIVSRGSNIVDVTVQIIPPQEITFRGETQHTFSSIEKNNPITFRSQLVTMDHGVVDTQHFIPFTIKVSYADEFNEQKVEEKTISLLLRPRTLFEWGPNAGLWIGGFYLAPTISIGTIVGTPLGIIGTLIYKRWRKNNPK